MRPRSDSVGRTTNFSFGFIPTKTMTFEEIGLTSFSQTRYMLNIDRARNREEIFERWKIRMNSVLNLNETWTPGNFLNYIKHNFSGTIGDWYDSSNDDGKNALRTMETPTTMFKSLCKETETESIGAKSNSKEKPREWQIKINNIELWDMRYLENYITEYS